MIVTKSKRGFHIIYHAAHGMLAGKIANQIAKKLRPEPWFETLIAITEHDDRQLNFNEKDYLSKLGIPLDFTEKENSVNEIIKRIRRIVKSAKNKSNWVRLLISYHLEFLYLDLSENSKKIKTFFNDENKKRKQILKLYGITDLVAREYYEFMRFCDRLSLILCKNEIPDEGRSLEINTSINRQQYFVKRSPENTITIHPWIFENDAFSLEIEETILNVSGFKSSKKFQMALENTWPELKKFSLIRT